MVATLAYWTQFRGEQDRQFEKIVETSTEQGGLRLEDFVRSRRFVLESFSDTYANGRFIREASFRNSASAIHDRFDGLLAINWIDADSRILWAEPLEPNRAAQGRRVDQHESAASFYLDSVETGELRATTPLELFQGGKGIAVYVPVFIEGQRRGTINGVLRADAMVETALRGGLLDDYSVRIRDGDSIIFEAADFAEHDAQAKTKATQVEAFDRTWTVELAPRATLVTAFDRANRLVLVVGLIFSVLIALLVYFVMARQRQRFETLRRVQLAERRLHEAQKFEALGRLARGVTHDFNNLLTAVNTGAQLMEIDEDLTESGRENLESIMVAAERAGQLTRQLMTFGQTTQQESKADPKTSVKEFAQRWERFVEKLVPAKVTFQYGEAPDVDIAIDDSSLARILTNLVINAVDAMPNGGTLAVEWIQTGGDPPRHVELIVRDDGTGIPDEVLSQIFDPYFTTKAEESGTGLGLPTVHELVTDAGGTIEVESTIDSGTTFTVSIPRPASS